MLSPNGFRGEGTWGSLANYRSADSLWLLSTAHFKSQKEASSWLLQATQENGEVVVATGSWASLGSLNMLCHTQIKSYAQSAPKPSMFPFNNYWLAPGAYHRLVHFFHNLNINGTKQNLCCLCVYMCEDACLCLCFLFFVFFTLDGVLIILELAGLF